MKHKNKKANIELKIGTIIVSCYLLWGVAWFIFTHFIQGGPTGAYLPSRDITKELLLPFQENFIFGTDLYGRSYFQVISEGLVYSIMTSVIVSVTCATLGLGIGHLAQRGGRYIKVFFDLSINLVFIFPSILIAILIMSILGQSFFGLIVALVITGWPAYAKISKGEIQRIYSLSFVESSISLGISKMRLFFTIIIPNILPLLMVHIVLGLSGVIMSEAALGFLGLGGGPFSWGAILADGRTVLLEAPHIVLILSVIMAGLILGLNLLGDGLRDYLDPKTN